MQASFDQDVNLERFAEALDDLNRAIKLHPERAGADYHRAIVQEQLGDQAGATADHEQAWSRVGSTACWRSLRVLSIDMAAW